MTSNSDIPFAKSLVDYIFRWMGMQFIPGYREANAPQRSNGSKPAPILESGSGLQNGVDSHTGAGSARTSEDPAWTNQQTPAMEPSPSLPQSRGAMPARGTGASAAAAAPATVNRDAIRVAATFESATLSVALESMADAPACDVCGTITVRSGTCYKCLNCGNSMGCS
jgi:ribonucleoside-diphosphate reductase alpha chain